MQKNIYEKIIELYNKNVDEWRTFMYENMWLLMRKHPLLKNDYDTYTKDDIYSEAFLFADRIVMRQDIDDKKKVSKLWFLFNRWGWPFYDVINKYNDEWYTLDNLLENDNFVCYVDEEWILEHILLMNDVISPIENRVLDYMKEWRGRYEIARLMKTSYHTVKDIIDNMSDKVKKFLAEINEEECN